MIYDIFFLKHLVKFTHDVIGLDFSLWEWLLFYYVFFLSPLFSKVKAKFSNDSGLGLVKVPKEKKWQAQFKIIQETFNEMENYKVR